MANYNADIRIGVTGKSQLNQLESQLKRVNKQVNALNKALTLKSRAQTIKLNTKGANTAIKQLEDRINKLGRTITVNLRTNESRSGGSKGGGNLFVAGNSDPTKQLALARQIVPVAKQLTKEQQKQLELGAERTRQIDRLKEGNRTIKDTQADILKNQDRLNRLNKSSNNRAAAGMFGAGTTREQAIKRVSAELRSRQNI